MGKTALLSLVLLALCGCVNTPADTAERAKALRVGMTKSQVEEIMGKPVQESFSTPDLWFYYVETVWLDGLITEDECMPLVFENGKLIGFGRKYYNEFRLYKKNLPNVNAQ